MAGAAITLDWTAAPPPEFRGGAVAVGNFDGLHRGHAALLAGLVAAARSVDGPAVIVTFDPPPIALLAPGSGPPLLTTLPDRAALLPDFGVEHMLILRTDRPLLDLSPDEFHARILGGTLAARAVVEGDNFRFGRGRAGDVALLRRLCERDGIAFRSVPPVEDGGVAISSSRVRSALLAGDVAAAGRWLGRPYRLRGVVGPGARRGRTIGFPTANLHDPETLVPRDGVYAAFATVPGHRRRPAAVNIGPNPTFGEGSRKIEAHLINFADDVYGQPIALDFVARLRDTRPFSGPDELVEQLRRDVEEARRRAGPDRPGGEP